MYRNKSAVFPDKVNVSQKQCSSGRCTPKVENASIPFAIGCSKRFAVVVNIAEREAAIREGRPIDVNGDTIEEFIVFDY